MHNKTDSNATVSATVGVTRLTADIVIAGGSLSTPAAALQAARSWPEARILVIEPTDWLGGQTTSQGVPVIDNAWHEPGRSIMLNEPERHYPADYLAFLKALESPPEEAPGLGSGGDGCGWVSREPFDPRTAAWILDAMVAKHPNIQLLYQTVVKAVQTEPVDDEQGEGRRIVGLDLVQRKPINGYRPFDDYLSDEIADWYEPLDSGRFAKHPFHVAARDDRDLVVVDASELADVVVLSGAEYSVGRETETEDPAADGSLPAMDEAGSQCIVFPFCITGSATAIDERELQKPFPDFAASFERLTDNFFSLGTKSWINVWCYRRLKAAGPRHTYAQADLDDVTNINWYPGNDYPYGSILKDKSQAAAEAALSWFGGVNLVHLAGAEQQAVAFYFYLKSHPERRLETRFLKGDDPLNMMGTRHGLAKFPYIRCTRRIVGLKGFRLNESHFVDTDGIGYAQTTSYPFPDTVGIGNYAVDIHPLLTSKGLSPGLEKAAPFHIPYRSLASHNVRNLLVGGKLIAGTYITNAAYRLHPIEWAIGNAAGAAAALMAKGQWTNYDLLDAVTLRCLQEEISRNSPIHWPTLQTSP
ncbi:MAG: FAD-dependent oxidoreductase [Kiritimatiellia bacterium]